LNEDRDARCVSFLSYVIAWPAVPLICICIFGRRLARYHQYSSCFMSTVSEMLFLPLKRRQQHLADAQSAGEPKATYVVTLVCALFQRWQNITLRTSYGDPGHGARRATGARTIVHSVLLVEQGHRAPSPTAAPREGPRTRHVHMSARPTGSRAPAPTSAPRPARPERPKHTSSRSTGSRSFSPTRGLLDWRVAVLGTTGP